MILMGSGMTLIWAKDIISGKFSGQGNFLKWKEGNTLLWPHIVAEYLTAFGLIAGGIGLIVSGAWALPVSFFSLGAVIYSAVNSSGWVLAERSRLSYGIPIWISLLVSLIALVLLTIYFIQYHQ
jgi:hypothetical protein